nr:hypothetical protein [Ningiella ruwaisensis]
MSKNENVRLDEVETPAQADTDENTPASPPPQEQASEDSPEDSSEERND